MNVRWLLPVLIVCCAQSPAKCESAAPLSAMARLPVREVTVFKDGNAFVLHEGKMPTDGAGNVVMDYLPSPVLGTFWPYSQEKNAKLTCVVAGQRKVLVPRTALSVPELIEANPGAAVTVEELSGGGISQKVVSYDATIEGVPTRSSEELEATSPPNSGEKLPVKSGLVMLRTATGLQAVPIDHIQTIAFKGEHNTKVSDSEFRNLLNLKLKWEGKPEKSADVGMVYLQKGLRWIPNYKINLHSDGSADVKLQATVVNELTDLQDVTANFVIGVPSFAFDGVIDPIKLEEAAAQLSSAFTRDNRTANAFSNAIMAQAPMMQGTTNGTIGPQGVEDLGPEVGGSAKTEDLFVFTAQHLSLKKGQRMVVPIAQYNLKYKDLYALDIPFSPPPEVRMTYHPQDTELAKQLAQPVVTHKIRLTNKSNNPLTTAPTLILKDDKLIAQSLMNYTGINGQCDLKLTTAVDVSVKKTENETKRTANAMRLQDDTYGRVDLNGTIKLTNFFDKPIEVEVKRLVLGKIGTADAGGKTEMINVFEDSRVAAERPHWWAWYDWPYWWSRVNSIGEATWNVDLPKEKPVELHYTWSYYWR